jgi:hypothetical protein
MSNRFIKWPFFRISLLTYLPAFILVLFCFALFRYANNPQKPEASQVEKQAQLDLENLIKTSLRKELAMQNEIIKKAGNTDDKQLYILDKYVSGEIYRQLKEESESAAKDEIEKLKADWKGELFGQISFPVLFAIASIFAAFAVKDVLTEILKDNEKEKLESDMRQDLGKLVGVNLSGAESFTADSNSLKISLESSFSSLIGIDSEEDPTTLKGKLEKIFSARVSEIKREAQWLQTYTYWLEYKLLSMEMASIFNSDCLQADKDISIEMISRREQYVLEYITSSSGQKKDLIRRAEQIILQSKTDFSLLGKENPKPESWDDRETECFKIQMNLLLVTLDKLKKSTTGGRDDDSELNTVINTIKDFIGKDFVAAAEEGRKGSRDARAASSVQEPKSPRNT